MKTSFFYSTLLIVIITVSVSFYLMTTPSNMKKAENASEKVLIGGGFTLEDSEGHEVQDTDFNGRLMLVYFGFTYCPDICPTGLQTISRAMELLGDKAKSLQPIFITLDPERDTRTQMASYMKHFDPRIIGLTGTKEQIAAVIAAYRVYANKVPGQNPSDYMIDHSAFMYLMDREGAYITHFGPDSTAEKIAVTVREHL